MPKRAPARLRRDVAEVAFRVMQEAAGGIRQTPAMAAGLADHVCTVEAILEEMGPGCLSH
jgi:hypothetical protein